MHKIIDICKSELVINRDDVMTQMNIEDFKFSLPTDLFELLISYQKEVADFEHAQFIIENENWKEHIILTREEIEGMVQGKLVKFLAANKFRVESYILRKTIS